MKSVLYTVWKHLNKKKDVQPWVYRLHKYLSKKLIKKGRIDSFTPLKIKGNLKEELKEIITQTFQPLKGNLKEELKEIITPSLQGRGIPEPFQPLLCCCYKKFLSLKLHQNTMETLIIGSSHAYNGYRADEKYNEINAAEVSQDLYYSYEIYKKFADAPALKNIVCFFSVFSPGTVLELSKKERFRCDFYKVVYDIPYRFIPEKLKENTLKALAEYLESRIDDIDMDMQYVGNCDYSGFLNDIDVKERVQKHLKHNKRSNRQTKYIKEMAALAKEKGHRLYIVFPPCTAAYMRELPPTEELYPDLMLLKDNFKILSFLGDARFEDSDFGDCDHLNQTGAEKLTALIREAITAESR